MSNLFNKLMIKGQKYKLMWGRVQNDQKRDEEEEVPLAEKNIIEYKTECPIFDPNNYNPTSQIDINTNKLVYPVSKNIFDVDSKPFYPSMDPNALGGLLKKNKFKRQLIEERNESLVEEIKDNK